MTISRDRGEIYFECDAKGGCAEVLVTGTRDFGEAREFFDENNWRAFNTSTKGWQHLCPDHADDQEIPISG